MNRAIVLGVLLAFACLAQTPKEVLSTPLYRELSGQGYTLNDIHNEIRSLRSDQMLILKRGAATAQKLSSLESRVESLDVTRNTDRLTLVEEYIRQDKEQKAKIAAEAKADRQAMMEWLRPLTVGILASLLALLGHSVVAGYRNYRRVTRRNIELDQKLQALENKADEAYAAANNVNEKIASLGGAAR